MPKSQGQKNKILYLLKILQEETDENNQLTAAEIMRKLENFGINIERKTFYSDIETLREIGYDVVKTKTTTTRYFLASRDFELPELEMLLDAVQASKFISYEKSLTLIKKIESLASRPQAIKLHRGIYIEKGLKTQNKKTYYAINAIHEGISENKKISFYYFKLNVNKEKEYRHGKKLYVVSPFALIWDDEKYYLIAYDSEAQKIKNYRVDKMENATCTDEDREGMDEFKKINFTKYSSDHFSMFGGNLETVTLKCTNNMADIILDRFGHDIILVKNPDGTFNVNVHVYVSPIFIAWLFNFGGQIKVISPSEVIAQVKQTTKDMLKIYE